MFNFMRKFFRPKPRYSKRMNNTSVYDICKQPTVFIQLLDSEYNTVSNMEEFLKYDRGSEKQYVTEIYDCEQFAFDLQVNVKKWAPSAPFGIIIGTTVHGGMHAWNFFIDENDEIVYVEPQNDKTFKPSTENIRLMII